MSRPTSARTPGFATAQVHAGQEIDDAFGSRVAPIHIGAGFVFDDFDQAAERFADNGSGYSYSRMGNPSVAAVERKLAALEGGIDAIAVGSGQAALSVALLGILRAGDHLVSAQSIYEGSRGLFRQNLAALGIETTFVDESDPDAWRAAIRPTTRALFGESIANPRTEILDIPTVAAIAREHGIPLLVDNTLATPFLLRPIEHGADIVVHSTSKFLSGHGTALGGAIIDAGRTEWVARTPLAEPEPGHGGRSRLDVHGARAWSRWTRDVVASRFGPVLSPFNAFLLQQGIETLSLRIERHTANALAVAEWLEGRPEVARVDYAGLASSPHADLARRLLPRGAGSVFAVTLAGGEPAARAFVDSVELITRMTHLGDVRSLVLHPASTSHAHLTADERARLGIEPGTLRLSIGIEDVVDLLDDLERALEAGAAAAPTMSDGRAAASADLTALHEQHLRHAATVL